MPIVWNRRSPIVPETAIYVGRPTKWGNPFVIGKDGTRADVIRKYREHIYEIYRTSDLFPDELAELRGRDLVCWCAPAPCHADVLLELANA